LIPYRFLSESRTKRRGQRRSAIRRCSIDLGSTIAVWPKRSSRSSSLLPPSNRPSHRGRSSGEPTALPHQSTRTRCHGEHGTCAEGASRTRANPKCNRQEAKAVDGELFGQGDALGVRLGSIHGWCEANPAQGIPLLPRPQDAPERNRSWKSEGFGLVCERASPQLKRALMLAHYPGMRIGDVVSVTWSCWDGEYLNFGRARPANL
jgi:hypothetical protein